MKRYLYSIPFVFLSISAYAKPYIIMGYGMNSISHDQTVIFKGIQNVALKPDNPDEIWSFGGGYRKGDVGFEIRYHAFMSEAEKRTVTQPGTPDNNFTQKSNVWDAELASRQISIKPLYFYDISETLSLKTGAGLSYTQYVFRGLSYEETDHTTYDVKTVKPIGGVINPLVKKTKEVGFTGSVAVDYNIWKRATLGLEMKVHYDKMATTTQFLGTIGYAF